MRTRWAPPCWKATRSTRAAGGSTRPAVTWGPSRCLRHTDSAASARPPDTAAASLAGSCAATFTDLARCLLHGARMNNLPLHPVAPHRWWRGHRGEILADLAGVVTCVLVIFVQRHAPRD